MMVVRKRNHFLCVCTNICLFLPSRNLGEECDDGDLLSGDGCSRTCNLEEGFNCAGEFRNTCAGSCSRFRGIPMSYFL